MTSGHYANALDACIFLILFLSLIATANAQSQSLSPVTPTPVPTLTASRNVTVPVDASQIVYTPFVCTNTNSTCEGAWERQQDGQDTVISTMGPSSQDAFIIPQMFLRFHASALYMMTSSQSNATANVTISSNGRLAEVQVNTNIGNIVVVNLSETQETQIVLTFVPPADGGTTWLGIKSILLTVTDTTATSSFLPPMTLPPTMQLPTYSPTSTSATPTSTNVSSSTSRKKMIAEAVGLTVGLGLGLTLLLVAFFLWFRRRRRKRRSAQEEEEIPPNWTSVNYSIGPTWWERLRAKTRKRTDDNRASWFDSR